MKGTMSLLPDPDHTSGDVLLSSSDAYVIRMTAIMQKLDASFAAHKRRPAVMPRLLRLLGEIV